MRTVMFCLVLAACGQNSDKAPAKTSGSGGPPSTPRGETALAKMGELRDQACACKDKACVDRVNEAVKKWSADDVKANGSLDLSYEQGERMAKIAGGMGECIQNVINPPHTEQ